MFDNSWQMSVLTVSKTADYLIYLFNFIYLRILFIYFLIYLDLSQ